ncbi:hypothetical protein ABP1_3176 [Bacillus subtilis]|nr:hypothetical protein ABP1_3176 [Bacillus subtilis]
MLPEHLIQLKQDLIDGSKIEMINKLKRWAFSFLKHLNFEIQTFQLWICLKMLLAEFIPLIFNNISFTLKINITTQYIST